MPSVWIVHRDASRRIALARLADLADDALCGAPGDAGFASAAAPRAVVLGLAEDLELELDFAHRTAARHVDVRWLLLCEEADRAEVMRLFDAIDATLLPPLPRREELRAGIEAALRSRAADPLSERRRRDAIAARYSAWLRHLELPELLHALDPQRSQLPLLVRGEPGTGRALLARYVHAFGGSGGPIGFVPGSEMRSGDELVAAVAGAARGVPASEPLALCIEDADALAPALQRTLVRWIELGLPGPLAGRRVRWMGIVGDDENGALTRRLEPALAQALAGVSVRIPPLRERSDVIPALALALARAAATRRGGPALELADDALAALREDPWPDNLRELASVVTRSVAASSGSPLRAADLRFGVGAGTRAEPASTDVAIAPEPDPQPTPEPPRTPVTPPASDTGWLRRLAGALAHEIRNPLTTIRSLAELLPERASDPAFRERFQKSVGGDVLRIERSLARLGEFAALRTPETGSADVTALLEETLAVQRKRIESRALVVLKELEASRPRAVGSPEALGFLMRLLLDHALEQVPDRGGVYLTSKHHAAGPAGSPVLRVLMRFDCEHPADATAARVDPAALGALSPRETALSPVLAERLADSLGGTLAVDQSSARERVLVVDLPATP